MLGAEGTWGILCRWAFQRAHMPGSMINCNIDREHAVLRRMDDEQEDGAAAGLAATSDLWRPEVSIAGVPHVDSLARQGEKRSGLMSAASCRMPSVWPM